MKRTIKINSIRSPRGAGIIIVGGAPRSGTTMTQAILDTHPQVSGGPEFDCLPMIVEARNQMLAALSAGRISYYTSVDEINCHFGGLIESFFHQVMKREEVNFLSEKTPANILVFEELMEILPAAKFVEVVRDPRAVVSSMLKVSSRYLAKGLEPPQSIGSLEQATNTVEECIHKGYCAYSRYPDRVLRIRYEDLVNDTLNSTKILFEFLGLEQHTDVFSISPPHKAANNISKTDLGLWDNVGSILPPLPTRLMSWRDELSDSAQQYISSRLSGSLSHIELGYTLSM